jgi:hypothetical protein
MTWRVSDHLTVFSPPMIRGVAVAIGDAFRLRSPETPTISPITACMIKNRSGRRMEFGKRLAATPHSGCETAPGSPSSKRPMPSAKPSIGFGGSQQLVILIILAYSCAWSLDLTFALRARSR